ncbi:MAG TPA: STAS/SEC14 domain-containing protein [Bacteroidia bacterium]|nr:STAS/SEC14 domain-containing protein [Bacteroidia bacterium]
MRPPGNAEVFEHQLATLWFDEEGILHSVTKPVRGSIETMRELFALTHKIADNQKVCLLSDVTSAQPLDKQTRDYIGLEGPKYYKAVALFSHSVLGKFVINILMALQKPPIPAKMFNDEDEAKKWLKHYMDKVDTPSQTFGAA